MMVMMMLWGSWGVGWGWVVVETLCDTKEGETESRERCGNNDGDGEDGKREDMMIAFGFWR